MKTVETLTAPAGRGCIAASVFWSRDHRERSFLEFSHIRSSTERQAQENLLVRLEKAGLVAPPGPMDEVLNTIVNNLIAQANLNVEAHWRVADRHCRAFCRPISETSSRMRTP
jgi:hypothetical protein